DGTPHTSGICYGASSPATPFVLYCLTSKRYKKARNIQQNPIISFLIPFPHYYLRFAPSGTITINGIAEFVPLENAEIQAIFSKKRILRRILKEISTPENESFTFIQINPNPKIVCHGVGYNIIQLRKGHKQAGYSVRIPPERTQTQPKNT
ncbi:MAG: hypothetical protein ACFFCW_47265, partial [Candidatus Hodarchaeota archaeon]